MSEIRPLRRRHWLASALALALLPGDRASGARPGFLELESTRLDPFYKWNEMRDRHLRQDLLDRSDFRIGPRSTGLEEADQRWRRLLRDAAACLPAVLPWMLHERLSSLPYVPDPLNYGVSDLWSTPRELFANGGDCEDYAIACFHAVLQIAPETTPRLTVIQPRTTSEAHAVCIFGSGEGMTVLDSLTGPRGWNDDDLYLYSIDHERWWRPADRPGPRHRGDSRD